MTKPRFLCQLEYSILLSLIQEYSRKGEPRRSKNTHTLVDIVYSVLVYTPNTYKASLYPGRAYCSKCMACIRGVGGGGGYRNGDCSYKLSK
jgi:hypothetical protein